jgi:hypothetical protein
VFSATVIASVQAQGEVDFSVKRICVYDTIERLSPQIHRKAFWGKRSQQEFECLDFGMH